MQYLIELEGKKHVVTRVVDLPNRLLYSASAVYRSTNTGDFICVKNRHGMMEPLSKESATIWILSADPLDISPYTFKMDRSDQTILKTALRNSTKQ
jgi:hypothetical protein